MFQRSTHYELLQVEPDSSFQQIRAAYLRKIKASHPDMRVSVSSQAFISIKDSYNVLKDADSRIRQAKWETAQIKSTFENQAIYQELEKYEQVEKVVTIESTIHGKYPSIEVLSFSMYARVMALPSIMFFCVWIVWTVIEIVLLNYRGREEVRISKVEGKRKATVIPVFSN